MSVTPYGASRAARRPRRRVEPCRHPVSTAAGRTNRETSKRRRVFGWNVALDLTQDELRSSDTPWKAPPVHRHDARRGSFSCEVLIVGAGVTGALVAERLTREGRDVVIVDREDPTQGSTLASTAMLLWDIDRTLGQLVDLYGFERAVRAYQASHGAARGLIRLISQCGV